MSTKESYFASLSKWEKQSRHFQMFYYFLYFSYTSYQSSQLIQPEVQSIPQDNTLELREELRDELRTELREVRRLDGEQRLWIIQRWRGTEMLTAPFWKRALAEIIDIIIIFIVKFVLWHIVQTHTNVEKSCMFKSMSKEEIRSSLFENFGDLFSLSNYALHLFLFTKLMVMWCECLWITYNNGSSFRKQLMNLRVLYVDSVVVVEEQPEWVLIYPAMTPNCLWTFIRVITKHLIVTFFPVCVFALFLTRSNQTIYDKLSNTIVVERNTERPPPPRLR